MTQIAMTANEQSLWAKGHRDGFTGKSEDHNYRYTPAYKDGYREGKIERIQGRI